MDRIFEELMNIRKRLDDIERTISNWKPQPLPLRESELFSLPDNLRKTYLTVASKGECSATQVSNLTGRSRAIESNYLNQLARMGWLIKRRNSKTLQFRTITSLKEKHVQIQTATLLQTHTKLGTNRHPYTQETSELHPRKRESEIEKAYP
jgi:hypothetical protein